MGWDMESKYILLSNSYFNSFKIMAKLGAGFKSLNGWEKTITGMSLLPPGSALAVDRS